MRDAAQALYDAPLENAQAGGCVAMQRSSTPSELLCSGCRRRRSCDAAVAKPPELLCSGRRRRRSCDAAAAKPPQLLCRSRRRRRAAMGAVMQRPRSRRSSMQRSSTPVGCDGSCYVVAMKPPELLCNGLRRRQSCDAAAAKPPELLCSGRRRRRAAMGAQRLRSRRSCYAAVFDAAGAAMQRLRRRREEATQRSSACRWSKIAQHLPGRTDNEIKNYWRTRVQKHAKQLNCDVGSATFKDAMRYLWMPRLVEPIHAAATTTGVDPTIGDTSCASGVTSMATAAATATTCPENNSPVNAVTSRSASSGSFTSELCRDEKNLHVHGSGEKTASGGDWMQDVDQEFWAMHMQIQPDDGGLFHVDHELNGWVQGFSDIGVSADNLWSLEDIWKMQ